MAKHPVNIPGASLKSNLKNKNMSTSVVVKCQSKKISESYNQENPVQSEMEFVIPYDAKSVFT